MFVVYLITRCCQICIKTSFLPIVRADFVIATFFLRFAPEADVVNVLRTLRRARHRCTQDTERLEEFE